MLSSVRSASVLAASGMSVTVEAHIGLGLPAFTILGRPDDVCRESRDRVRTAMLSSGFHWPDRRVTLNLAPSTQRKVGSALDLAIAISLLVADEKISPECVEGVAFIGELALDGRVRQVAGVAPMALALRDQADITTVVVPAENVHEARIVDPPGLKAATSLREVVEALTGCGPWPLCDADAGDVESDARLPDLCDVRGQAAARLGLELSAAGGHHLLLVGPPGAGKTMLAQRLPGILPRLDQATSLEATLVRSAAGEPLPRGGLVSHAPIRMPHHSASTVSMVGGGSSSLRPGEVSLAHGGVLFLDELGEFAPSTLDALRQPLEEGVVRIARANARVSMPARFTLVGATNPCPADNPCPCGGGAPGECECDERALARYRRRFNGPFLDRFDVRVLVHRPKVDELLGDAAGEPSSEVVERVQRVRELSIDRQGVLNAQLSGELLDRFAPIEPAANALLRRELEAGRLTGRGLHRVRRVARTLADRDGDVDVISEAHMATALALRARIAPRRGDDLSRVI